MVSDDLMQKCARVPRVSSSKCGVRRGSFQQVGESVSRVKCYGALLNLVVSYPPYPTLPFFHIVTQLFVLRETQLTVEAEGKAVKLSSVLASWHLGFLTCPVHVRSYFFPLKSLRGEQSFKYYLSIYLS